MIPKKIWGVVDKLRVCCEECVEGGGKHAAAVLLGRIRACVRNNSFGRRLWDSYLPSEHAEIAALRAAGLIGERGVQVARRAEVVVIRAKGGELRNSAPCSCCTQVMRMLGVRRVYYSTGEGRVVGLDLRVEVEWRGEDSSGIRCMKRLGALPAWMPRGEQKEIM